MRPEDELCMDHSELSYDCEPDERCVMCGKSDDTTICRDPECDHRKCEPLCEDCDYKDRHRADQMYCDAQFAFYNKPEEQ